MFPRTTPCIHCGTTDPTHRQTTISHSGYGTKSYEHFFCLSCGSDWFDDSLEYKSFIAQLRTNELLEKFIKLQNNAKVSQPPLKVSSTFTKVSKP